MRKTLILALAATALLFTSCANSLTRGGLYPKMYNEHPTTILVMPPINNTTNVEAKDFLYTSISYPLVEAGYYVISPHMALDFLKSESAYDAELFIDKDASIFGRVFGADAVVFSIIDTWKKVGFGIETDLHYIIKSTATNEVLFERRCNLYLDLEQRSNSEGWLSTLIDITASAITTALTDHIVAARKCNYFIFKDIPRGKYSPDFLKDDGESASARDISRYTIK